MHQTFNAALELNLLHANQEGANHNRAHFDRWQVKCLNVMSSPGAGKTELLERTLAALRSRLTMAIIEGDMTTELDAERLRQFGVPVFAINTGRSCHLDARMVAGGIHQLEQHHTPTDFDLIFGASKLNLKICDLPVRYQSRTYGETQINRWRDGFLLIKMAIFAARKVKFI